MMGLAPRRSKAADAERWRAVLRRDSRRDGTFVFGVRSTGIYCRPSCPARRPRREVVVFFPRPDAAARAGFRSCRRCRPEARDPRAAWLGRVCRLIEQRPGVRLGELSGAAGVSPHHLQKTFKRLMGVTPHQYADERRLGSLKAHLKGGLTVSEATYEAGYGSSSRLYERAKSRLGMTPAAYRRGGRGLALRYATFASPLGRLLVAATERGIAALSFGESDRSLEAALREEYRAADIRRDEARLRPLLEPVLRHIEGRPPLAELPLDVQATAFQRRVWEELRRIPLGETRTYGQVARAIGRPAAVRAVARACAQNRVGVVIPCHRVVGAGGSLTGYRWGLERKAKLLAREREAAGRARSAR